MIHTARQWMAAALAAACASLALVQAAGAAPQAAGAGKAVKAGAKAEKSAPARSRSALSAQVKGQGQGQAQQKGKAQPAPKVQPKTPPKTQPKPSPRPAPSGGAQPGVISGEPEYRLQREDVIRIQILDREQAEINQEVQIGRDGRITPPFLEPFFAEGLTISKVRSDLTEAYTRELKLVNPRISVVLARMRDMRASVVGAVRNPGTFQIRQGDSLLNLLGLAGDALPEVSADLRRATLTRARSREIIPVDIVALRQGDMSQNYEILDGDILAVPQEQGLNRVLVFGRVRTPGPIPFIEGITLMDALSQAGDIPNQTRFSRVQVIREIQGAPGTYQRITCNIVDYLKKGDVRQNIRLQRRDVIFVPDTGNPNFDQINQILGLIFVLERFGVNIFRF